MQAEDKIALFLYAVGKEKMQKMICILDSAEIRRLMPALQRVRKPSAELQQEVFEEFILLGYQPDADPATCVNLFRALWHKQEKQQKKYTFYS